MTTQPMALAGGFTQSRPQTDFWRKVQMYLSQFASQFPADTKSLFIISTPDQFSGETPQVVEVLPRLAAECLAKGNHRLATKAEIADYADAQEKRAAEYAEIELRRDKPKMVTISQTEAERIGLAPPAKKGKD